MLIKKVVIIVSVVFVTVACVGGYVAWVSLTAAPTSVQTQTITIEPGESVDTIINRLEQAGVVRSGIGLELVFAFLEDSRKIKAGTYSFTEPQTARVVAQTLVTGQFVDELIAVTFLEGTTAAAFGQIASATLENFDSQRWADLTAQFEGRLFPETYRVPKEYTAEQLFTLLREQHDDTVAELTAQYPLNGKTVDEVVTLASILEREANDEQSMRTVAGIFQNRRDISMPLQADATIEYVLDTPLNELPLGQLANELRDLDSPYNTYLHTDLPPTPIGNPGRQALQAVLNPIDSDYLFYITGNDGEFYYGTTYNQHLLNIERHLR